MIDFELCAQTSEACADAQRGGAARIELCSDLEVGGLTPAPPLIAEAVGSANLPVHVLLRPTAEHFLATPAVVASVVSAMRRAREFGAAGFVLGFLNADSTVDAQHTRELVEEAAPLPVTFHRAFDQAPNLSGALEEVIATGCTRLLSSGGQPNVLSGASRLAALHRQAAGRITVMAGGGLRLDNARMVAKRSQLHSFHGSLSWVGAADQDVPLWLRMQQMIQALSVPLGMPESIHHAHV